MQKVATTRVNRRLADWRLEDGTAMQHWVRDTASLIAVASPEHHSEWKGSVREHADVEQLRRGLNTVAGAKTQARHISSQTQALVAPEAQQTRPEDKKPPCTVCDGYADLACCTCRLVLVRKSRLPRQGCERCAPETSEAFGTQTLAILAGAPVTLPAG